MIVSELVAYLLTQQQDMHVVYPSCSEQAILEIEDISVIDACEARSDGWVHDSRPDKPTMQYLSLGG